MFRLIITLLDKRMNILKAIKNLYEGEDNFAIHLSIFAITGIIAIAFVNISSLFMGNSIYSIFYNPGDWEIIIFSILAIMLLIFFIGYKFKYTNRLLNNKNSSLPSVSMDCFSIFAKMFPIFLIWGIYLSAFLILCGTILGPSILNSKIAKILILLLIPFINIIFILFTQDFKYRKYLFNPLIICNAIKNTFFSVLLWITQYLILFIIITIGFKLLFNFSFNCETRIAQLSIILFITSLSGYVQEIINLAYINGIAKIVKENYPTQF
jgi:hypothetical protein